MIYKTSLEHITPEMLNVFFVGWPNPPQPETHLKLLKNSYKIVVALDEETKSVIGFISAISDGVLSAYIPLLEVLPEYQGRGIGQELVRRMLLELKDIYMVDLLCDENLQAYYEKAGMVKANGMLIRNYEMQSGK
ncbi:GNAT family N-acetyltransferase [Cytobacillus sp. FJAT-54145]|uniref:GNAT family N-acetyltransferase n=1 Tax=Cytobacillus spartinae TaxID=3299023 RepID=A0ABW6KHU7_9BACI